MVRWKSVEYYKSLRYSESGFLNQKFQSPWVYFSYYLPVFAVIAAVMALVFSINKPDKTTLKSLFEKPSTLFLILLGIATEFFAALTRTFYLHHIVLNALLFGSVYLCISCLITFHNKQGFLNSLIKFSVFGIVIESIVGTLADMERGNTFFTVYFVAAMLMGMLLGSVIGLKLANKVAFVGV